MSSGSAIGGRARTRPPLVVWIICSSLSGLLAAKWLAAGFDSPDLRRLAQDRSAETRSLAEEDMVLASEARATLVDLMRTALRSIGFDPAPADEEFTARCQSALNIVRDDLDVTGYGRYRMRARIQVWPAMVFPTLPDSSCWGGSEGMGRHLAGSSLLCRARPGRPAHGHGRQMR
ncbi:MAG: hypothetical protein ACYCVZ_00155 [Streptosporangiaceae bacterium]